MEQISNSKPSNRQFMFRSFVFVYYTKLIFYQGNDTVHSFIQSNFTPDTKKKPHPRTGTTHQLFSLILSTEV